MMWLEATATVPILGAVAVCVWYILRVCHRRSSTSAMTQFIAMRSRWSQLALENARQTGKPRGLIWLSIEIIGEPLFERLPKRIWLTCIAADVRFEAIPDSEMEDNPAVPLPRSVTLVFQYERTTRSWRPTGKVVFNHTPEETLRLIANR